MSYTSLELHRIYEIVRHWHQRGIASGRFVSDIPFENLDREVQLEYLNEARQLCHVKLRPRYKTVQGRKMWVWEEIT